MQNVLKSLRAARLPTFVEKTHLGLMGQQRLREAVQNEEYRTDEGSVSFLLTGEGAKMGRASAVFCKELVLYKVKAVYVTASYLHQLCSFYARHGECDELDELRGCYLVVPDLTDTDWHETTSSRRLVFDFLMTHFYRGDGLAICKGVLDNFGYERFDDFLTNFKTLAVV